MATLPFAPNISDPRFDSFCNFLREQNVKPPSGMSLSCYVDHHSVLAVPVVPIPGLMTGECWYNCLDQQMSKGGQAIYGWSLWQHGQVFVAQHHAVWRDDFGVYHDPTPNQSGTNTSLFMPDHRAPFDIMELRAPANFEWESNSSFTWFSNSHVDQKFFISRMTITANLAARVERLRRYFSTLV